jgi:hypothetical protein
MHQITYVKGAIMKRQVYNYYDFIPITNLRFLGDFSIVGLLKTLNSVNSIPKKSNQLTIPEMKKIVKEHIKETQTGVKKEYKNTYGFLNIYYWEYLSKHPAFVFNRKIWRCFICKKKI